jgi:hypothetical protein
MKSIYLFLSFVLVTASLNAQEFFFFDKKFKRVRNQSAARYIADSPNPNQPSKVVNQSSGVVYAKGVINEADTLSFDGKVMFYDDDRSLKGIRFYKKGVEMPAIKINAQLKKQLHGESSFYMLVNDDGEFCAYKKETYRGFKEENMIAIGRVTDTSTLTMDSTLKIFNENRVVSNIIKYNKGVEIPFIATTTDVKEPYNILNIVSHLAYNFSSIDAELEAFKLKCKLTGADGVIGIHTSVSVTPQTSSTDILTRSQIVIQGTAIKLKKKIE